MHKLTLIVGLLCGALSLARIGHADAAGKDPAELLRQGLFEEEANRDPGKAATAYAEVVGHYDSQRTLAATALFRLAEIRAAQGNKTETTALYQRLLAEFANQETLVKLGRERLAALGVPAPAVNSPGSAPETLTVEEANELARVRDLVRNSPDLLNALAAEDGPMAGYTPLTWAAQHGWERVATFLLEHDAKANGSDNGGEPLKVAVAGGHKRLAEILLAHGAGLDAATPDGWTALHAACYFRRNEIARLLLEKGANANVVFTQRFATEGTVHRGWGPELKTSEDKSPSDPLASTPLLIVLANADDALISFLLDHGADPNLYASVWPNVDKKRSSPLIEALFEGAKSTAKLLIQHGAKVDFVSDSGATALSAAASGTPDMVPSLLDRGRLQIRSSGGDTPLSRSIWVGGLRRRTADGLEPMATFKARFAVYTPVWEAMLAQGADINTHDDKGQTPLFDCAPSENYPQEVAAWLLSHGADINARDARKSTPLHHYCAIHSGGLHDEQKATLRWLIDSGADVDARDSQNQTPFDLFESKEAQREFYYPHVAPKLNKEQAVTAFFSLAYSSPSGSLRVVPQADFDAPPTLVGLMLQMAAEQPQFSLPLNDLTVGIYRAGSPLAPKLTLRFGDGPGDASKWPVLRWGDVVVFESDNSTGGDHMDWLRALPATLKRTVSVQIGDRAATLTLAEPPWKNSQNKRFTSTHRLPPNLAGQELTIERWAPTVSPLPTWTLSELVARLTAAEPRARLDAVRVERTTDGAARVWTVDLRGGHPETGAAGPDQQKAGGNPLLAQLADGDRLIIPLLPAQDSAALAARRRTISFAAPGRLFAETVFTRFEDDTDPSTLGELLMQAYTQPLLVPNPDLSKIVIHRLSEAGAGEEHVSVDFTAIINSTLPDAAAEDIRRHDPPLRWGDVVEISPVAGVPPAQWTGFGAPVRAFLDRALSRNVAGTLNGVPLQNFHTGENGLQASSLLKPKFYSCAMVQPLPGTAPVFPGENLSWKQVPEDVEPFTAAALMRRLGVDPNNLVRFVIHQGSRTREYDGTHLGRSNPLLPIDATVDIQQFAP